MPAAPGDHLPRFKPMLMVPIDETAHRIGRRRNSPPAIDGEAHRKRVPVRPVTRYSPFDSVPRDVRVLNAQTAAALAKAIGIKPDLAKRLTAAARRAPLRSAADLEALGLPLRDVRRLANASLFEDDMRVAIGDVQPAQGPIMSDRYRARTRGHLGRCR